MIDVQLLLASGSNQTAGTNAPTASGQPGAFAQQFALASSQSGDGASGLSGDGLVVPDALDGAAKGSASWTSSAPNSRLGDDSLPADLDRPAVSGQGSWHALLQQLSEAAELSGQQELGALESSPRDAMPDLLDSLPEQLPSSERETQPGLFDGTLSPETVEALLSEWRQLGTEGQSSLIVDLAEQLPDDVRQQILDSIRHDRLGEAADTLIAELAEQQPDGESDELLNAAAVDLTSQTSPQMDERMLALAGALLAAQQGEGQSSKGALRLDLSELRGQLGEAIRHQRGLAQVLALNSAQRGALTAESSQALLDASSQRTNLAAQTSGFRDAILSAIASRDGSPGSGQDRSSGDGTTLASGTLGGPIAAPSASVGASSAPMTAGINAPLASPAWPQQLGQQLVMLTQRGGEQKVEIRLNPPELGPLTVSLKVVEQSTQIQFLAASAQVRGAVEQAIPQLREALAEQGIQLGETSVGEQQPDSDPRSTGEEGQGAARGPAVADETDALVLDETASATAIHLDGRVDLYA